MSYFLWIEDFENSPKVTAQSVFGDMLNADLFSDTKRELKKNFKNQGVFIELNFQDGLGFIRENLSKIDYVILDIDLPAYSEDDDINEDVLSLLSDFQGYKKSADEAEDETLIAEHCKQLKAIAGFYLYTELVVELGFPKQHILFCSNHAENTQTIRDAFKVAKIALPDIYEKSNPVVKKWVREKYESPYSQLRRGVIEACQPLKKHTDENKDSLQFKDFIKTPDHEISNTDIKNYLDTLAQSLPLKEPNEPNSEYRLFLRTLAHEWEENISAEKFKENYAHDLDNIHDIYTFGWILKMTRNWVSHANLLEPLNPQFIAFLFLINMRAMFKLPKALQRYEVILLSCMTKESLEKIDLVELRKNIKFAEQEINGISNPLNNVDDNSHFGQKINEVYRQNTGNPDAETHDFQGFLLQYFWVNQKKHLDSLIVNNDNFLPVLARHIYNRSFL